MNDVVIITIDNAKVQSFVEACNKIRAIPDEIALYFDVSQKSIRVSDLQQQVPYQPRCPRTS